MHAHAGIFGNFRVKLREIEIDDVKLGGRAGGEDMAGEIAAKRADLGDPRALWKFGHELPARGAYPAIGEQLRRNLRGRLTLGHDMAGKPQKMLDRARQAVAEKEAGAGIKHASLLSLRPRKATQTSVFRQRANVTRELAVYTQGSARTISYR